MEQKPPRKPGRGAAGGSTSAGSATREDRLKSALKANLAKRKAQARRRAAGDGDTDRNED